MNKQIVLFYLKKITGLTLIAGAFYNLAVSIIDIVYFQSQFQLISRTTAFSSLHQDLLKKAVIISTSLFIDSLYGFSLLIKPFKATKTIHIILGIVIIILSQFLPKLMV